jgi:hypothetical protein
LFDTVTSVLVFLVALAPGYVFLRTAERRVVKPERSDLLTAAEMAAIGATCTALSTLTALGILHLFSGRFDVPDDLHRLAGEPARYLLESPGRSLVLLGVALGVLALSYLLAWRAAEFVHRREPRSLYPDRSAWQETLGRQEETHEVYATVELEDGRTVTGWVHSYTPDADSEVREIVLTAPISAAVNKQTPERELVADYLVVSAERIVLLATQMHKAQQPDATNEPDAGSAARIRPATRRHPFRTSVLVALTVFAAFAAVSLLAVPGWFAGGAAALVAGLATAAYLRWAA